MDEIRAVRAARPYIPTKTVSKKKPRLAYEIALGIIIGGVTLWTLGMIAKIAAAAVAVSAIKIHFGG